MPHGHWSGCHAVGWDYCAPEFGDLTVGDNYQKHSYPLGLMVNNDGERFVDEGADFRNYTCEKKLCESSRQGLSGAVCAQTPSTAGWRAGAQARWHRGAEWAGGATHAL